MDQLSIVYLGSAGPQIALSKWTKSLAIVPATEAIIAKEGRGFARIRLVMSENNRNHDRGAPEIGHRDRF